MTHRRQWVRHTDRKVPLTGVPGPVRPASSTDASTWCTYRQALRSPAGVGVGFVLTGADRMVCIDLDHALVDGELTPWARAIVERMPETYIEVSPSGEGLHVWGYGALECGRKIRRGAAAIELYDRGRFITVTHRPFENAPPKLADLSKAVAELL